MRLIIIIVAAVALGVTGCGRISQGTSALKSGITGKVTVDAGCPTVKKTPCPRVPLRARLVIYASGSQHTIARAESSSEGIFRIPLAPGSYQIQPQNVTGAPVPTAHPVTVIVRAGKWTRLQIQFDSGVR